MNNENFGSDEETTKELKNLKKKKKQPKEINVLPRSIVIWNIYSGLSNFVRYLKHLVFWFSVWASWVILFVPIVQIECEALL